MNFVHVSLLAGISVASIPLLLHLLGRKDPKPILFPALRFVRQTAVQSQRGWTVKRWLLLLLRMAMIVLAALALASPRVHSAMLATTVSLGIVATLAALATAVAIVSFASHHPRTVKLSLATLAGVLWAIVVVWGLLATTTGAAAPTQASVGPIAAAIIIDNGPTMDYRFANETRFEAAQETARWLLDRLPVDSQIAILHNAQSQRLTAGRATANRQLDSIKIVGKTVDLPARIRSAIELVRASKLNRREVYVITDLSVNAWQSGVDSSSNELENAVTSEVKKIDAQPSLSSGLAAMLAPNSTTGDPVLLQVIDVGVIKRENWSLTDLSLSQQSVTPGSSVNISAIIRSANGSPETQLNAELWIEERDNALPILRDGKLVTPKSTLRERKTIDVAGGGTARVDFAIRDVLAGSTNGSIRIARPDPLAIDSELAFTIDGQASGKVLIVSPVSVASGTANNDEGRLVALAIDPTLTQTVLVSYNQLAKVDWRTYSSVILVDPPELPGTVVDDIHKAIQNGTGAMLIMGPSITSPDVWNDSPIHRLLPGKVAVQWRRPVSDSSYYFSSLVTNHPLWSVFDSAVTAIPWNRFPVYRYWVLDPLQQQAMTLAKFSGSSHPAITEHSIGKGRVLVVTTPLTQTESLNVSLWNRLMAADDAWPTIGLIYGAARYLAAGDQMQRNFVLGQPAILNNPTEQFPDRYDLFTPDGQVIRVQASEDRLLFPYAELPGTYRLKGMQPEKPARRSFSYSLDDESVNLDRVSTDQLNAILGANNFSIVSNREEIQSSLGEARFGRDLTPFLLVLMVAMIIAEQAMSYRFYSSNPLSKPLGRASSSLSRSSGTNS
jgi:hypothetical protein